MITLDNNIKVCQIPISLLVSLMGHDAWYDDRRTIYIYIYIVLTIIKYVYTKNDCY